MKMFGILAIIGGMVVLAGNVFDFYRTPTYVGWIPIGLGLLTMVMSESGVGA